MYTTAAHSVLLCQELYHLICEGCDLKTLSALSRTSRDLQETALDHLWSDISELGVLVRCMPSDLWEERRVEGNQMSLVISFEFYKNQVADEVLIVPQDDSGYGLG